MVKKYILESILYVISQLIFSGSKEIAQGGGENLPKVLPKVLAKLCINFGSSKFHENRYTNPESIWRSNVTCMKPRREINALGCTLTTLLEHHYLSILYFQTFCIISQSVSITSLFQYLSSINTYRYYITL